MPLEADKREERATLPQGREGSNVSRSQRHVETPEPGGSKEGSSPAGLRELISLWQAGFSPIAFEKEKEYISLVRISIK